ncbi:BlaI/MecI/CopY family transcriptional regulator [Luteipulveratus sp. YIM 133132]|uniref:BlaI/MecI/CopY family transcriptional regulator n=1 Tax=Luteipulveratus flavus TaxID=3031728 RepID=A0ABT6C611_9MICO|nr:MULTISPECIES: BlaI/MecI/CopY family transcriptional regulator [unclassified Luteipulveratus]MDE9366728.1 BlaI/MecI/CopY family transcriptional regulator [Luteipulveratus sp. YIM 133132]MDF8264220.1 BlaI/MecI/CopY family transcriptional regulator [Luteipulveratus sp. YIM 133296]
MRARGGSPGLGDLEAAVMHVLWTAEAPLSVREVHAALSGRDLAYTTVMTVLDRLAKKNLAARQRDGRAWQYTARSSREELTAQVLRSTLGGLEPADRTAALLHFLGDASPGERDELRAALDALEHRAD